MAVDLTPVPTVVRRNPVTRVRAVLRHPLLLNGSTLLFTVLVLLAAFAPLIAHYGPVDTDSSIINQPPSAAHWFGTDTQGMDILSRVLWAARTDLALAVIGVALALVIGLLLGSAAAFAGSWLDEVLSRIAEMFQSIPLFLFALMVIAALGNEPPVLAGIIAVFYAPAFFKVARAVAAPLLAADFVAVARTAGRSGAGIVVHHFAPNAIGPLLSQFSINVGFAIQVIAGLSFLGLGIPIPQPEWGSMIAIGASRIAYGQWWMAFFPGLAVFLTVIALDGIGRRLSAWESR